MCWPYSARINHVPADTISKYVEKGIALGKRPELTGGGLIRSMGGWGQAKALRRTGTRLKSDERILGESGFVEQVFSAIQWSEA